MGMMASTKRSPRHDSNRTSKGIRKDGAGSSQRVHGIPMEVHELVVSSSPTPEGDDRLQERLK